jgi:hypothetical protein
VEYGRRQNLHAWRGILHSLWDHFTKNGRKNEKNMATALCVGTKRPLDAVEDDVLMNPLEIVHSSIKRLRTELKATTQRELDANERAMRLQAKLAESQEEKRYVL